MCWNSEYTTFENVLLVLYRACTYLFPAGLLLWNLVIDKLIDKNVSFMAKIGCGGLFLLIAFVLIAVIMLGIHFKRAIERINEKLIDCVDSEQKQKLVEQKKKIRKHQAIYRNSCLIAPFIIVLVAVTLLEQKLVTFRGTLTLIVLSMAAGFGFNISAQNLIVKNK